MIRQHDKLLAVIAWVLAALVLSSVILLWILTSGANTTDSVRTPPPSKIADRKPMQPKPAAFTFPGNKQELANNYRFVALYGLPGAPVLGILGEQDVDSAIIKAKELAAQYQVHSKEIIYPTLEIITTVASGQPTSNGDYSRETDSATIMPWIIKARQQGVYVLLDLQPGRANFLTQAQSYEELLREPNVGLALDPEWRLNPDQMHLRDIGGVDAAEVNQTSSWLADLAKDNQLPQKVFLLHQFRMSMIRGRDQLDTSRTELRYMIQMDGQGAQPVKQNTWNSMIASLPSNFLPGWKNFIDEDSPMLTPEQTMNIVPQPWLISYQ